MRLILLLPVLLFGPAPQTPRERVAKELHGWTVHVDPELLDEPHAEEGHRALSMLGNHLERISLLVRDDVLEDLRTVELVIDRDNARIRGMQYHPDLKWVQKHADDPSLHRKVHIPQASELLSRSQLLKHPAVILHELAHGYHHQILGFGEERIRKAYAAAVEDGAYERVLSHRGRMVRHYALKDAKEYFAEGTEAYLYRNDFYPFVAAELETFDPGLHALLGDIWGPLE